MYAKPADATSVRLLIIEASQPRGVSTRTPRVQ
jgi:hypothetical protein